MECGTGVPKWAGRCPGCDGWNTLIEEVEESVPVTAVSLARDIPVPIAQVDSQQWAARSTGNPELDRVTSGGFVPGSVTLVGGEPGIGKSTLLLQAASSLAATGAKVLYVSAEESKQQVRLRATRLGALEDSLFLASETSVTNIITSINELQPDVVVVDSIQTVSVPELTSAAGSVAQVRESAARLVSLAKEKSVTIVLVGHVTKDGNLAGPRVLEHLVDTVIAFEGDRHHALRLVRAVKHRFGSTDQLGLFEMTPQGLIGVPDPSRLFLADRRDDVAGSVVTPAMEGDRPLLVEVQALVTRTDLPSPRRNAQGIDTGRLSMVLAVLAERVGQSLSSHDVYVSAVGGVRLVEPAVDLALAVALVSAHTSIALPDDLIVCGEIGLGGEIRQVSNADRRLAEAARLGFKRAVVPRLSADPPEGLTAIRVDSLGDAIKACGLHRIERRAENDF